MDHRYWFLLECMFFFTTLSHATEAEVVFGVESPGINEVIFEGENVLLVCSTSDEKDVKFSIFLGSVALIRNGTDSSGGVVTNITITDTQIRFVLLSVEVTNLKRYSCEVHDTDGGPQVTYFDLRVSEAGSVQCKQNSSLMYLSMQSLELSCYFTTQGGDSFDWYKTDPSGSSAVLASSLNKINSIKSRSVSLVEPSAELTPATFSCQSSTESNTGCVVAMTYVVYNGPFIIFDPTLSVVQPGSEVTITCRPVDIPGVTAVVFWNTIHAVPEGVTAETTDSETLQITVELNATLDSIISGTCCMFIGGEKFASDFTVTVQNEPGEGGRNESSDVGLSVVVLVIVGVLGAATLAAVLLTVVCILMIRNNHDGDTGTNGTRLSQIYGKVDKTTRRSGNDEANKSIRNTNEYDVSHVPAVSGESVGYPGDSEMGHYAGVRGQDNDPNTSYNRVNHGYIPDEGVERDHPEYEDWSNDLGKPDSPMSREDSV